MTCTTTTTARLLGLLAAAAALLWASAEPQETTFKKPDHENDSPALMARWLAHSAVYGTLSTVNGLGKPVGGIVSHSAGSDDAPTGHLYFYLTKMDELPKNFVVQPAVSYTVTEAQLGMCDTKDAEDPSCVKGTFIGNMRLVPDDKVEAAKAAIFARHPAMTTWSKTHHFDVYELEVETVHLLDWFGGMKYVTGPEYYAAQLTQRNTPGEHHHDHDHHDHHHEDAGSAVQGNTLAVIALAVACTSMIMTLALVVRSCLVERAAHAYVPVGNEAHGLAMPSYIKS